MHIVAGTILVNTARGEEGQRPVFSAFSSAEVARGHGHPPDADVLGALVAGEAGLGAGPLPDAVAGPGGHRHGRDARLGALPGGDLDARDARGGKDARLAGLAGRGGAPADGGQSG